ncbi:hypothetical protein GCM10018779_52370 [Streptomyces griseocarneus]|nr:hypothetical protein GCM10018779_52370 [Streptomyces griseocarneus]
MSADQGQSRQLAFRQFQRIEPCTVQAWHLVKFAPGEAYRAAHNQLGEIALSSDVHTSQA